MAKRVMRRARNWMQGTKLTTMCCDPDNGREYPQRARVVYLAMAGAQGRRAATAYIMVISAGSAWGLGEGPEAESKGETVRVGGQRRHFEKSRGQAVL